MKARLVILRWSIILISLSFFISCVSKNEHEKVLIELEECKEKSNFHNEQVQFTPGAFATHTAHYTSDGKYSRTVEIPYRRGHVRENGQQVDLTPKVVKTIDFSDSLNLNYIVFEIYQHGLKEYRNSLRGEPRKPKIEMGVDVITKKINNFDPKLGKTIYVIPFHDEHILDCPEFDTIIKKIKTYVQDEIKVCKVKPELCQDFVSRSLQRYIDTTITDEFPCLTIESANFDKPNIPDPRTVGNGGVIPPRKE